VRSREGAKEHTPSDERGVELPATERLHCPTQLGVGVSKAYHMPSASTFLVISEFVLSKQPFRPLSLLHKQQWGAGQSIGEA
jgi:hypothetical protein